MKSAMSFHRFGIFVVIFTTTVLDQVDSSRFQAEFHFDINHIRSIRTYKSLVVIHTIPYTWCLLYETREFLFRIGVLYTVEIIVSKHKLKNFELATADKKERRFEENPRRKKVIVKQ